MHSPSTASGVATALRASKSRQNHSSVCSGSPLRSRPVKGQPPAPNARLGAAPPCELQPRRWPTQLTLREACPGSGMKRGVFFRPSLRSYGVNFVQVREREATSSRSVATTMTGSSANETSSTCFFTRHSAVASRRQQLQGSTALRARLNARALTAPRTPPTPASHLCHSHHAERISIASPSVKGVNRPCHPPSPCKARFRALTPRVGP